MAKKVTIPGESKKAVTVTQAVDYTEKDIGTLRGLNYVRKRPTSLVVDTGTGGQRHICDEIIVNSLDELTLNPAGKLTVVLFRDVKHQTYQILFHDTGRGIPLMSLRDSYCELNTSGKFEAGAYVHSGGLFGQGAKAAAGLSRMFRGISRRPNGIGSVLVQSGVAPDEATITEAPQLTTGVTVVMEPDKTIFSEVEAFGEEGYKEVLLQLQKYSFFGNNNIEFKILHRGIDAEWWTASAVEALIKIDAYINEAETAFSSATMERPEFLKDYWKLQRPFAWSHQIIKPLASATDVLGFDVRMYYVRFDQAGGRLGLVNNVPIDDSPSHHFSVVYSAVKAELASRFQVDAVKKFFQDSYRFMLFIASNIKLKGAAFAGTTKHAFTDPAFSPEFRPAVQAALKSPESQSALDTLFAILEKDVTEKYQATLAKESQVKNTNRLFSELNFGDKYVPCRTKNRAEAELFLVEGDSAGNPEGRNVDTQAIYLLRGKPRNAIKTEDKFDLTREKIRKDEIYQDIFKIMNINMFRPNLDERRFERLNIMTDADPHGMHIAEILLGAFWAISPEMVESGIVSIVIPPLVALDYNRSKDAARIYLRDHLDYQLWMITTMYHSLLDIHIQCAGVYDKPRRLKDGEYVDFMMNIWEIGDMVVNVANELAMDPLILEMLAHVTQYLSPGAVDTTQIHNILNEHDRVVDKVTYRPLEHILVLSLGAVDYHIPLHNVPERLYEDVLPLMNRIRFRKLDVLVSTKRNKDLVQCPVTIVQLYQYLKKIDDQFTMERFKGLGQMPAIDRYNTCMDPERRRTYQVTSVGDVRKIFGLLGAESAHRKRLLTKPVF